jgi:hypothetical protein
MPGAFHPLHEGHVGLRDAACKRLGGPVWFELSLLNVDKPPLDFLSLERRRRQFDSVPLALTAAPTFVEKACALPGAVFVVGVDTAKRIIDRRYYGGGENDVASALSTIRERGCRFLVAGRKLAERFETLADLPLPAGSEDLFEAIGEAEFRRDISSTALRQHAARK